MPQHALAHFPVLQMVTHTTHTRSCTHVNCSTEMEQAATVLDAYDYRLVAGFD